jgi:hypothetical protein
MKEGIAVDSRSADKKNNTLLHEAAGHGHLVRPLLCCVA